jgi:uncharacterized protein (TIGR03435 family)
MLRVIWSTLLTALAFGQTQASRTEFEVASIKPSPQSTPGARVDVGMHVDGAQVRCNWLSLADYIGMAYQVKPYQISGPEWLTASRFDVAAKVPSGGRNQIPEMIQALLSERFHMKMHREKKEYPVYVLSVGKSGSKLQALPEEPGSEDSSDAPGGTNINASGGRGGLTLTFGRGSSFTFADNRLVGKKLTMASFADTLGRFMDRPVVDTTELKGAYDFTLNFTPEDYRAMLIRSAIAGGVQVPPQALRALEASSGDSLRSSLEQLGLKLDSGKTPIEVLIIDGIDKLPTEN